MNFIYRNLRRFYYCRGDVGPMSHFLRSRS